MANKPSPLSIVALVVMVGLVATWMQNRAHESAAASEGFRPVQPCPDAGEDDCAVTAPPPLVAPIRGPPAQIRLSAASVCTDVGYLCDEVERTGQQRVKRWPDGTSRLRVHVPLPEGDPRVDAAVAPGVARNLQRAAVRGIQLWQGRPFQLLIDTGPTAPEGTDIKITWGGLGGGTLGSTRFEWLESRDPQFVVHSIELRIRTPGSGNPRSADGVTHTAAHEMGHALGLPNSDSERDIMSPMSTVLLVSPRDFRTLNALYDLPFMAWIYKNP